MATLIFKFSKKIPNNYFHSENGVKNVNGIYTIFSNDRAVGKFVTGSRLSVFEFDGKTFEVEAKWRRFKSLYYLVDKSTRIIQAEFVFNSWVAGRKVFSKLITSDDKVYEFQEMPAPVKSSIFKRSTWGYLQFKLYSNNESVIYNLKVDMPLLSGGGYAIHPAEGTAELINIDKQFLVFAGLYLIEQYFFRKDI